MITIFAADTVYSEVCDMEWMNTSAEGHSPLLESLLLFTVDQTARPTEYMEAQPM
jgi:hypothetical protein